MDMADSTKSRYVRSGTRGALWKLLARLERQVADPAPYPCPMCGAPIVAEGPPWAACQVCDYEGDL